MIAIRGDFTQKLDYWAAGINHFFVDFLNSGRNLIVALLALSIGLTNADVGLVLLIYNVGNALSQPFFGILADRIGPRWLIIGGTGWMIFFSAVTAVSSDWVALIAITAVGVGSGAFHPSGTKIASSASKTQRNRATALFFLMGQSGLFVGPIVAGIVLETWGRIGYMVMPLIAVIAFVTAWQWIEEHEPQENPVESEVKPIERNPINWWLMGRLGLTTLFYSTVGITLLTFLPKWFAELDYDLAYIGWLAGAYMIGGAFGNMAGGILADRFSGKLVVVTGLLLTVPFLYFGLISIGALQLILLAVAGFLNSMPHSILIISVQELIPGRQAFASGLILGFIFFSGSVGSYVFGFVADGIGLGAAMQWLPIVPLAGGLMAITLGKLGL